MRNSRNNCTHRKEGDHIWEKSCMLNFREEIYFSYWYLDFIYSQYLNIECWNFGGDIFSLGIVCFAHNWNRISIFWWFYPREEDIIVCNSISAAAPLVLQREIMETNIFCQETLLQENIAVGKYNVKRKYFTKRGTCRNRCGHLICNYCACPEQDNILSLSILKWTEHSVLSWI